MQEKKEKILIFAGDGAFGEKVAKSIRDDGYADVYLLKNGTEGLKGMHDLRPDLVILDVSLPGMDGYEILSKKHTEPDLAKIPVFLMSTQGLPINMRNIPADSVDEFIMGIHIDPGDILAKVNRHFSYFSKDSALGKSSGEGSDASKKKLLWVEDDKLIGTILAKKLISSGFNLFHAQNGEEALHILETVLPDVIVVDLILPGMSGFDILQKVNEDQRLKKIPRIVLSNLSKPSDMEKAKTLGAVKFLVKAATSLDQIVAEVKAVCN